MPEFKGFDDWFEIFAGGTVTDMNGKAHDGNVLIQKAVASFAPDHHEPPIVVGHPVMNSPAYGWIEGLKAEPKGDRTVLMAKAKQVVPEFSDAVEQGLYKKRSASFNPDGSLRHVGFLGAKPPAVKGLADLDFHESPDAITIEFATETERWAWGDIFQIFRRLRDHLLATDGKEVANEVVPEYLLTDIDAASRTPETGTDDDMEQPVPSFADQPNRKDEIMADDKKLFEKFKSWLAADGKADDGAESPAQFSEADIKAAEEKAAKDAKAEAAAEFAEKQRAEAIEADKARVAEFCDAGVKGGTLAPAWVDAGIKSFMEQLAETPEPIQFAEGDDGKKAPLDWFIDFMEGMPKLVDMTEFASRDKNVGDKDETLEKAAETKMEADKDLSFAEAMSAVAAERPELLKTWLMKPVS